MPRSPKFNVTSLYFSHKDTNAERLYDVNSVKSERSKISHLATFKYRYCWLEVKGKERGGGWDCTAFLFLQSWHFMGHQPAKYYHACAVFSPCFISLYSIWRIQCTVHTCTHIQWYYAARIYPSIQLIRGKGHISNQPGIYCYILGTKIST